MSMNGLGFLQELYYR